jgi:EpsI family protein
MRRISSTRLLLIAFVLLSACLALNTISHGEKLVPHEPVRAIPYAVSGWLGREQPYDEELMQEAGVTDYTNRLYLRGTELPVQVYVAYYASQRSGDTIHSPKNCLPGTGWDPVESGYAQVLIPPNRKITVNRYVVEKYQEKQLVFYWYQGRGRITANEYASRFAMMADAISKNRTDGALVRLATSMQDGQRQAESRLVEFTRSILPGIDDVIPK